MFCWRGHCSGARRRGNGVTVYLWALYRPRLEPKKGFGDLSYLIRWLNKQDLPGEAPADWVVMLLKIAEREGRSVYVYDEDGPDQWTVTLTRTGLKVLPAS